MRERPHSSVASPSSPSLDGLWRLAGKHVYVHTDHLQSVCHFDPSNCDGYLFDGNKYKGVRGHTPV